MKKADVKVGGTYLAKVSGKVAPVHIDAENPRGGWDATNTATGKKVRIKSAQRLRGAVHKSKPMALAIPAQAGSPTTAKTEGPKAGLPAGRQAGMTPDQVRVGHVYSVRTNGRRRPVLITERTDEGWKGEVVGLKQPEPVTITDAAMVGTYLASLTAKFGTSEARAAARQAEAKKTKAAKPKGERKGGALDAAVQILKTAGGGPLGCKEMVERMLAKGLWQTKGKTPAATLYAAIIREIAAKGRDSRFRKDGRGQFALAAGKDA